jgi:hypothetical protein
LVCTPTSYLEGLGFDSQSNDQLVLAFVQFRKSLKQMGQHLKTGHKKFLTDMSEFHSDRHPVFSACKFIGSSRNSLPIMEPVKFTTVHHEPNLSTPHSHILFTYEYYTPIYASFCEVVFSPQDLTSVK